MIYFISDQARMRYITVKIMFYIIVTEFLEYYILKVKKDKLFSLFQSVKKCLYGSAYYVHPKIVQVFLFLFCYIDRSELLYSRVDGAVGTLCWMPLLICDILHCEVCLQG